MKKYFLSSLIVLLLAHCVSAQVITVSTLATGFTSPVCIQNSGLPNDDRLFIIERAGKIRIMNRITGIVNPVPFLNIVNQVISGYGEQGLLGLAFDPDYANNGYFYVDYTGTGGIGNTVISRFQVSAFADTAITSSQQIMLTIYQPNLNHNGGNLMFGWDDYLYISMGDGGNSGDQGTGHNATYGNAQHIDSLLGKLLRIDVRNPNAPYYYSPSSNPFYGGGAPSSIPYAGVLPGRDEIFDWGLRNPWRCSIDRMTGDKWIADVGQGSLEEIDFESRCDSAGKNYGWRCYEGTQPYNTANCQGASSYTSPVFAYSHSLGCSVTGGYVYRGGQEGALFGKYLFADYCSGRIWATVPNGTGGWTTNLLTQTNSLLTNNITTFGEDIYGELYLAGNASGNIYKLVDTACAPTAYINAPDTIIICSSSPITFNAIYGQGLTYFWTAAGAGSITGQGTSTIIMTPGSSNGFVRVNVTNSSSCIAQSNTIYFYTSTNFTGLGAFYCDTTSPVTLSGVPSGGTFSGPGINGNMFSPSVAGVGTHQIIYTYADTVSNCYYTASGCILTDTQTVVVDICTGIDELNSVSGISIYPNPNHSEFTVEFALMNNNDVSMAITDAVGRVVKEQSLNGIRGKQKINVSLDVESGIYFLRLQAGNAVTVSKVIVQK